VTRLAFLTPLPPLPTGIADYAIDVLRLLGDRHEIDVFHDQPEVEVDRLPSSCGLHAADRFLSRHRDHPYGLAIYQMGNADSHAFIYDLMARVPGLLVLHDLVLHHARARTFLDAPEVRAYRLDPSNAQARERALGRIGAYRAELAYSYPDHAERLSQVHLATVGQLLPYAFPLFRIPVECSRATAAHNGFMVESIRAEVPGATAFQIPMPVTPSLVPSEAVANLRARHGFSPEDLVVGSFGLLTREKRIETVARAIARAAAQYPQIRLLLVGPVPDAGRLHALLERLGVSQRTVVAGRVPFEELSTHIAAVDLAVHLRYPTARETSAALLRLLAQGRPTVMSDLEHLASVPDAAVVRVDVDDEEGDVTRALLRLARSPGARARLGQNALAFMRREHSDARGIVGYETAIAAAAALPDPPRLAWPAHWTQGSPKRPSSG
jgi:glycosyltransferase involved in cell wall biosynthesis